MVDDSSDIFNAHKGKDLMRRMRDLIYQGAVSVSTSFSASFILLMSTGAWSLMASSSSFSSSPPCTLLVVESEVYPFVEMWAEMYSRDRRAFPLVDVDKTHRGKSCANGRKEDEGGNVACLSDRRKKRSISNGERTRGVEGRAS